MREEFSLSRPLVHVHFLSAKLRTGTAVALASTFQVHDFMTFIVDVKLQLVVWSTAATTSEAAVFTLFNHFELESTVVRVNIVLVGRLTTVEVEVRDTREASLNHSTYSAPRASMPTALAAAFAIASRGSNFCLIMSFSVSATSRG
jgi:hypothetical protein